MDVHGPDHNHRPMSTTEPIVYQEGAGFLAVVERVIDADTLATTADLSPLLGLEVSVRHHIRLLGVDAPERNTKEGRAATDWVEQLVEAHGWRCLVAVRRLDKYGGRVIGDLWLAGDPLTLTQRIIDAGHGKPYSGGKR